MIPARGPQTKKLSKQVGGDGKSLSIGKFRYVIINAEAIMNDSKSTPVLPRFDSAVESDAAIEHIGMAWLSTIDDVTLISIVSEPF